MRLYHTVLNARLVRSLTTGIIAVGAQTIIFEVLGIYLKIVSPSTAVALSAECGLLINFYLSNRFAFHDRRHNISILARLLRFHLVVSGSIFLQWLFVFLVERQTSSTVFIHGAYVAGLILGFIWNYTLYLHFVWRHDAPTPD